MKYTVHTIDKKIPDIDFNVAAGETLQQISGMSLNGVPLLIRVIEECPYYFRIYLQFREKDKGTLSKGYCTTVNKKELLIGRIRMEKNNGEWVQALNIS